MNTNMAGLDWFSKIFGPCALDERNLSIGKVNQNRKFIPEHQEIVQIPEGPSQCD